MNDLSRKVTEGLTFLTHHFPNRIIGLIDGVSTCQDHRYTKRSFLQSYKQVQVPVPVPFLANSKKEREIKKKEERAPTLCMPTSGFALVSY